MFSLSPKAHVGQRELTKPLRAISGHFALQSPCLLYSQKRTCAVRHPMSALGQKRTYAVQKGMSALPPKADMCSELADICFGPIADINNLFDHLIRTCLHRRRHVDAERL